MELRLARRFDVRPLYTASSGRCEDPLCACRIDSVAAPFFHPVLALQFSGVNYLAYRSAA
jgi:hypothetical protein